MKTILLFVSCLAFILSGCASITTQEAIHFPIGDELVVVNNSDAPVQISFRNQIVWTLSPKGSLNGQAIHAFSLSPYNFGGEEITFVASSAKGTDTRSIYVTELPYNGAYRSQYRSQTWEIYLR